MQIKGSTYAIFDTHQLASQKVFGSLSAVRTIVPSRPDAYLSIAPTVWTTWHTVRMLEKPSIIRPNPPLYLEAFVPACIGPDVSAARPEDVQ